jgi:hypothetical protein
MAEQQQHGGGGEERKCATDLQTGCCAGFL